MPAVDISGPSQPSMQQGKGGIGGLGIPTPLLLVAVGGGIGLIVFLTRKAGTGSGTDPSKGTLLPNTAIMLGSLQQGILNLQGQVSTGNADLSSQLTGVGENLGAQNDAQSAQIQQSFADLNTYLQSNFTTLQSSETALSTAIAGLGTQNASAADSLTKILANLFTVQNQMAQTGAQVGGIQTDLVSVNNALSTVLGNQTYNTAQLGTILNWTDEIKARLQQGDYSAPFHGPSNQSWKVAA